MSAGRRALLLVAFAALAAGALWRFALEPGTVGHNWDAPIAPYSFYLADIFHCAPSAWEKHALGGLMGMKLTTLLPVWVYSGLGVLGLDGHVASKGLLFAVLTLSMLSMRYVLVRVLTAAGEGRAEDERVQVAAWLGGVAYGISPFFFNITIGGAVPQYVTLPLLPLVVWRVVCFTSGRYGAGDVVALAVLLSLVFPSAQNFVLCWGFFALCCLWWLSWRNVAGFALVAGVSILLCMYALAPLFLTQSGLGLGVTMQDYSLQAEGIPRTSQALHLTFFGAGYNNRDFFLRAHPSTLLFLAASGGVLAVVLWRMVGLGRALDRRERLLVGAWLVAVGVAAVGKGVFAPVLMWAFENIPVTHLFRSPQRLMVLPTVLFPFVLALALGARSTRPGLVLVVTALLLLRGASFWSGDFGRERLVPQKVGVLDNYTVPHEYGEALWGARADSRLGRVAFLPVSISPRYLANTHQVAAQSGDMLVQACPDTAVYAYPFSGAFPAVRTWTQRFYQQQDSADVERLNALFSAKAVLFRRDVEEDGPLMMVWRNGRRSMQDALEQSGALTRVVRGPWCDMYAPRGFAPMVRPVPRALTVEAGS
ncbi:hypothetical protein [Desulfobaculum sp.]